MLWRRAIEHGESAAQWFLRRRRWEAIRWTAAHFGLAVAALGMGWLIVAELRDPDGYRSLKMFIALPAAGWIAVDQTMRGWKRLPAASDVERDPAVRRARGWGKFEVVAQDIVNQLASPVAMAGKLIVTQDYVIDGALDVRRIEDIHEIRRTDSVDRAYFVIERSTLRQTWLIFDDATIQVSASQAPNRGAPGIGPVLAHCQRRAPWLAASLGVDPAKLRPPAPAAQKAKRPQAPVVKNPPTRRPPPRAS